MTLGMGDGDAWNGRLETGEDDAFRQSRVEREFQFLFCAKCWKQEENRYKLFQQSHENSVANCGLVLAITTKCQIIGATTE